MAPNGFSQVVGGGGGGGWTYPRNPIKKNKHTVDGRNPANQLIW